MGKYIAEPLAMELSLEKNVASARRQEERGHSKRRGTASAQWIA